MLEWLQAKDTYVTVHHTDGSPPLQVVLSNSISLYGWAPDSRHIVGTDLQGLLTFDATTGTVAKIPGTAGLTSPRWSPDGTFIVAHAGAATVSIRPDGTGRAPFTGTLPTSPNGRWTLSVNATEDQVSAVDVITGEVTAVITPSDLAPGATYHDWKWGRADDTVIELYVRRDGTTVQRFVHPLSPPGATTSSTVAVGMFGHWVGGVVPADTNGTPPAVTDLAAIGSPGTLALSWSPPIGVTDFAGVDVRYALGTTPPATPTAGIDAGRILASTRTLTPLPPDQPVAISVFSHDWSGNVGPAASIVTTTPHQGLTTLTGRASPFDLVYGTRSAVTATLRTLPGGAGIAGDVGPHLTSALGTVTYTVRLPARGTPVRYRVRVNGVGSNLITGYSNIVILTGT